MLGLIYTLLVFVLVLGAMIVIHEFGHFIVAKSFGIRVLTFSVGFGKRLFGFTKGGTDYRLSLIPLGGYVKMAGENLDEERTGSPDEFMSKPKWQRFCVAIAGPAMNILTALAIPAIVAMVHFETEAYKSEPPVIHAVLAGLSADAAGIQRGDLILAVDGRETPIWRDVEDAVAINPDRDVAVRVRRGAETKQLQMRVGSVAIGSEKIGQAGWEPFLGPNVKITVVGVSPGSPAAEAGLQVRDQIIKVNGKAVDPSANPASGAAQPDVLHSRVDVIRTIQSNPDQPVTLTVLRNGETVDVTAMPRIDPVDGKPRIGFTPGITGEEVFISRLGLGAALKHSVDENVRTIQLTKQLMGQLFEGKRSARDLVTGPIGIAELVGQAAEDGPMPVIQMMGLLSLNLGIFNLLPIPVLDGGLIFMLGLEAVLGLFGLPLTLRVKERMMQVGMLMLVLLMGFVIFNDISKRFSSRVSQPPAAEQPKK